MQDEVGPIDDRWDPLTPAAVYTLLADVPAQWWIAGGHALELFAEGSWRDHGDIDVLVLRPDLERVARHLRSKGFVIWAMEPPARRRLWREGGELPRRVHDLWIRRAGERAWALQMMIDEQEGSDWVSRRDHNIRRPVTEIGRVTNEGVPYLHPAIQMFYKAKAPRLNDELDFTQIAPLLDVPSTAWLRRAIEGSWPDHPWLTRLRTPSHKIDAVGTDVIEYCKLLTALGIENAVVEHPATSNVAAVAAFLGIELADCNPTLILKADDSFIAVAIRGDTRVDFKRLKKGLRIRDLRMATPAEFAAVAQVELGTARVYNPGIRTVLDARIFERDHLTGGSGTLDRSVRIKTADLRRLPDSLVMDISDPSSERI